MAKKKKRSAAKKKPGANAGGCEAFINKAKEEMVALEAIFESDFEAHGDGCGFDLSVHPHPGEAEANFVSVRLVVR